MSGQSPLPARFGPLRPGSPAKRAALLLVGPVTWLVALVVLALVVDRRDAVELALIVFFASFAVGIVVLGWSRLVRGREERDG